MSAVGLPGDLARQDWHEVLGLARRWARDRLFSSRSNIVISVVLLAMLAWVGWGLARWLVVDADWDVVRTNRRLLLIGRFPPGEEWRVLPALYGFAGAIAWSWGAWGRVSRGALAVMVGLALLILPLLAGMDGMRYVLPGAAIVGLAYIAARRLAVGRTGRHIARRASVAVWFLLLPAALVLLHVRGGVNPAMWGGLYLNVIVASGAVIGALPLGFALALARTSSYRALRLAATGYIELMRGLPLPVMLILSWLALRYFLPTWGGLDEVPLVYRVIIAFALFTGAFLAEAIRGGLNAVPRGQREAAAAMGLNWAQGMTYIVLPQAVRNALPALAGEFIGLFMMTTLVAVVGLTDTLQAARATTEQPDFFGRQREVLLFVGVLFWVTAFGLSRLTARLERALAGSGRRRI